jgi:hypothetical protein
LLHGCVVTVEYLAIEVAGIPVKENATHIKYNDLFR